MGESRQERRGHERATQKAARRWGGGGALVKSTTRECAHTDEPALDTDHCPIGEACAGCGHDEGLQVATSALIGVDGNWQVACATLCEVCDGQPFIHLLGFERMEEAVTAHSGHRPATHS